MRKVNFYQTRFILAIVLPVLFFSNLHAEINYQDLEKSIGFIENKPYAVRYNIVHNNIDGKKIQAQIKSGHIPPNFNTENGFSYLTGECLYISDGKGSERFQFSEVREPYDLNKTDMISTHTQSMARISDKTVVAYKNRRGKWETSVDNYDADYLSSISAGNFRYPFFNLAAKAKENPSGYKSILSLLSKYKNSSIPDKVSIDTDNNSNTTIEFSKDGFPEKRTIDYEKGKFKIVYSTTHHKKLPSGYLYPQKANMKKYYSNILLEEADIEVAEILTGDEALAKYPVILPETVNPNKTFDYRKQK